MARLLRIEFTGAVYHITLREILGEIKRKSLGEERIYVAHVRYGYTLREIGDFPGVQDMTLGRQNLPQPGTEKMFQNEVNILNLLH